MAAAAATVQNNGTPPTPPNNGGRFRTGDDIDPMKDERSGLIREVGCQAIWSLSSCKPGFGVDQLRDQSLENYWQSDGQLPHLVNIQFRRKMTIRDICIYTDFKLDESYTPSKISIRCGTHFNDLQEVELVEFSEPSGWVQIFLKDIRDRPIRTFMLQLAVLSNHQNGRDTHLRQIRIHSPVDNLPVAVFPDVSIWLHQLVKGFRDKDGNPLPNAHLLGVFHRVCKLLNYGVKPVFVFDGGVPILKRQTLAARRQRKLESLDKAELYRQKLLSTYLQQQLQRQTKQALPATRRMQAKISEIQHKGKKSSTSPTKASSSLRHDDVNSIDEDLKEFRAALIAKLEDDVDEGDVNTSASVVSDDESEDALGYNYGVDYSENFSVIQAPEFDTLPLETQHEILFEMQESRKMNSWGKFDKMPKDLQTFSSFQMDRLVKRRTLQKKIQSVQQEMGQRHIHVQNLDDLLKMNYDFDGQDTKVLGSRNDGFMLVKSQTTNANESKAAKEGTQGEPLAGTSGVSTKSEPEIITIDDFVEDDSSDDGLVKEEKVISTPHSGISEVKAVKKSVVSDEEDEDIKRAIALSLQDSEQVRAESKEMCNTNTEHTIFEGEKYAPEESDGDQSSTLFKITASKLNPCAKFMDTIGIYVPESVHHKNVTKDEHIATYLKEATSIKGGESITSGKTASSDESDEDFEEVEDDIEASDRIIEERKPEESTTVATIDISTIRKSLNVENDIFADIFANSDSVGSVESDSTSEHIPNPETGARLDIGSDKDKNVDLSRQDKPSDITPHGDIVGWDSDSEIEADLVNMVIEESSNYTQTSQEKLNENLVSPAEETFSTQFDSAMQSTSQQEERGGFGIKPRIISASYLQAQEKLNAQVEKLQSEKGFQERVATSISDQMQVETQELISLFGIPYIISPTEAESQCAFLDRACLTDGTITDDSDVWLFGGQRVFKNFFSHGQRPTEFYQGADIQRVLNLNRDKLIVLAMLIGSDYSEGIQGVGPVLALEILSEFSSSEVDSFEILLKFRDFWDDIQNKAAHVFAGSKLKEKLRQLKLRSGFPSRAVFDAFMNPTVDSSTEKFKWGNPDLDAIRTYTKQKFGWDQTKCDSLLTPVLKNLQCAVDKSQQLTMDRFITFGKLPTLQGNKRKKGSKRMLQAVKKLRRLDANSQELQLSSESDSEDDHRNGSSSRKAKTKKVNIASSRISADPDVPGPSVEPNSTRSPGKTGVAAPRNVPKVKLIPQRVQEESNKIKNKQKAIEIFKKQKQ